MAIRQAQCLLSQGAGRNRAGEHTERSLIVVLAPAPRTDDRDDEGVQVRPDARDLLLNGDTVVVAVAQQG
ncbi:hypothetical protein [Actinomadura chokoriensis]|uniref:Uncharacterized protein n=1 Tax=Actinomadura chokoriensis TaxID=454156 RepID=A0ABV4QWR6_9ACTN